MREKVGCFFFMALIITIVLIIIIAPVGLLGMVGLTDGCLLRYGNSGSSSDVLSHSTTLQASGNYKTVNDLATGGLIPDSSSYGQWVNTGISVTEGTDITLEIAAGSISLCQAFLPSYNPEQNTANGNLIGGTGQAIAIPRVGDPTSLRILLPANQGNWFNIAKVDKYDQISVSLEPSVKPIYTNGILTGDISNLSYISAITGATSTGIDCSDGKSSYSPVCGFYTVYPIGSTYGTGCVHDVYSESYKVCCSDDPGCAGGKACTRHEDHDYWKGNTTKYPIASIPSYKSNGQYTAPYSTNISDLVNYSAYPLCSAKSGKNCNNNKEDPNNNFCYTYCEDNPNVKACKNNNDFAYPAPANPKFWFRSDDGTGLLYRFDSSLTPTNQTSLGSAAASACSASVSGYCFASPPNVANNYNVLTYTSSSTATKYLQYRLLDNNGAYSNNTGGYVLNIQQTKCQRNSGAYATDNGYVNRGQVKYVIVPIGENEPTNDVNGGTSGIGITFDANRQFVLTPETTGTLWMIIDNKFSDYQYSVGQYNVSVVTSVPRSQFGDDVLTPLLAAMRNIVDSAGRGVFQKMTCYNSDAGPCTNFFNYIQALLTLYIMIFGLMFLAGMTEITTESLVIRIIKITIVAGLINGGTYDLFNQYVFGLVTSFSDEIISNLAGYNLYSNDGVVNPLMFANTLMTKILFSKTTFAQMLALFSFGISGVFFFLLVFIGVMMIVAAIVRSFFVYIMSFVALAFLISLAPLFLTFLLFDKTYYLFEGWTRAIFRFMLEPIILLAGIIILTQLAEIYMDNILGWSVCWKCALAFYLPIPSFPLEPSFMTAPLFCINWFAPWGYDYRSGLMGIAMGDIVSFGTICFCAYGYGDFSKKMLQKITNSFGTASASRAAGSAISGIQKITGADRLKKKMSEGVSKARGKIEGGIKSRLGNRGSKLGSKSAGGSGGGIDGGAGGAGGV